MKRILMVIAAAFLAGGCATWAAVGGEYQGATEGFRAELPQGWLKNAAKSTDPLFCGIQITHDGPLLQRIVIGQMDAGTELLKTKKSLKPGMLTQEAAEVVLDEFRMMENLLQFEILSNSPADLGGNPGFRLEYDMKLPNHMWRRMVFYGAVVGNRFCFLHYSAPRRHYFQQDVAAFEEVVRTYRPLPRATGG